MLDDDDSTKYNGLVEIQLTYPSGSKIKWILSDCGCFPSSAWLQMLNFMKKGGADKDSPSVGGGGNSYWNAWIKDGNFVLYFSISGLGGDSSIEHRFPIKEMIPVVEEIAEKIKLME